MEVVAIIQARGGSKRVPRKNIKSFIGKPLIAWTIEAAKNAKTVTRVVVSTDDKEIADIAKKYGGDVPFLRPKEFASDTAKSVGLIKHALLWFKENEGYEPDLIVQLKPTNPLRTSKHIDECVEAFEGSKFDSLITVRPVFEHPYKTWKVRKDGEATSFIPENVHGITEVAKLPKQLLPEAYIQNSYVNVIKPETILRKNSSIGTNVQGFIMGEHDVVNIDSQFDFDVAEMMFRKNPI